MTNRSVFLQGYWQIVLFNFFVLSCVGLLLRYINFTGDAAYNYVFLLQAHSHFAFSAVLFLAIIGALCHAYLPITTYSYSTYKIIFWLCMIESYAMLYSFSHYGYNYISIIISTLYLFTTYFFAYFFYKNTIDLPKDTGLITAYFSLLFLLLSSLALWGMGPLMMKGYSGKPLYFNTVYYYLHFQYNGWFSFAVLAIFIRYYDWKSVHRNIIYLLATATVLLYAISVLWCHPHTVWYIAAFIGAIVQLYCVYRFITSIAISSFSLLSAVIYLSILCKSIIQWLSAFPYFADLAVANRNLIIAYLHLIFIGTLFLPLYHYYRIHLSTLPHRCYRYALYLFIATFVVTEFLMASSIFIENMFMLRRYLFYISILFPISILGLLFIEILSNKKIS